MSRQENNHNRSPQYTMNPRLYTIASMVRNGSVVADIGTDHGYLISYLVGTGKCSAGYATDLNEKPLEQAKKTLEKHNLEKHIKTICANGLLGFSKKDVLSIQDIVIAGMGGDLIASILLAVPWTQNENLHFILQPMTKAEHLREALYKNGFSINCEKAVASAGFLYTVMSVTYSGISKKPTPLEKWTGRLQPIDANSCAYFNYLCYTLQKKYNGFLQAGKTEQASYYSSLVHAMKEKMLVCAKEDTQMLTIQNFYQYIDSLAPFQTAESWDNVGLLIGSPNSFVTGVLLALDVTESVVQEAKEMGANLILTHHPIIFSPLKKIDNESLVYKLIESNLSVISAHTNLDMAEGGVNDVLAERLHLNHVYKPEEPPALLRVGELSSAMKPEAFAQFVKCQLHTSGVRAVWGKADIQTVAVCGGSGADRMDVAIQAGAQAFVTADVKHHEWLQAHQMGITLIDAGHFHTEVVVLEPLAQRLKKTFDQINIKVSKSKDIVCFM